MKIVTTTTYIGRNGEIEHVKKSEKDLYFETILPQVRQIATVDKIGEGLKITVTRLEQDNVK